MPTLSTVPSAHMDLTALAYPYTGRGFVSPLLRTFPAPSVRHVAAVPAVLTKTLQPAPSVIAKGSFSVETS